MTHVVSQLAVTRTNTDGCDCGKCFVHTAANGGVTYFDVLDSGGWGFRRTYEVRSRHVDPSWNLVKVTRRGVGVANESVAVESVKSGFTLRLN